MQTTLNISSPRIKDYRRNNNCHSRKFRLKNSHLRLPQKLFSPYLRISFQSRAPTIRKISFVPSSLRIWRNRFYSSGDFTWHLLLTRLQLSSPDKLNSGVIVHLRFCEMKRTNFRFYQMWHVRKNVRASHLGKICVFHACAVFSLF